MRLFTGLSLPPNATAGVLTFVDRLGTLVSLPWTKPEKLHITTKFIGEWPESSLPELQQALEGVALPGSVRVHIRGVYWMGSALCAGVDMSSDLHQATDRALAAIGVPSENRPFRPHVTLARSRRPVPLEPPHPELDISPFHADGFHLYLSANGTYTKLSTYPLPK